MAERSTGTDQSRSGDCQRGDYNRRLNVDQRGPIYDRKQVANFENVQRKRKSEFTDDSNHTNDSDRGLPEARLPSSYLGRAPTVNRKGMRVENSGGFGLASQRETDPRKLAWRLKQIKFGKNTIGYDNYIRAVARSERVKFNVRHPVTPDPYQLTSKRGFDAALRRWRVGLHSWDTEGESGSSLDGLVESTAQSRLTSPGKSASIYESLDLPRGQSCEALRALDIEQVDYDDDIDGDDDNYEGNDVL